MSQITIWVDLTMRRTKSKNNKGHETFESRRWKLALQKTVYNRHFSLFRRRAQ